MLLVQTQGRKCSKQGLYVDKLLSGNNLGFWRQRDPVEINLPEQLYFWTHYLDCKSQSPPVENSICPLHGVIVRMKLFNICKPQCAAGAWWGVDVMEPQSLLPGVTPSDPAHPRDPTMAGELKHKPRPPTQPLST